MIVTYNPENVQVTLNWTQNEISLGTEVLKNWNSISISFNDERYEFTTSTTGQITRSKILNKLGNIEIVTPDRSDVCQYLSKLIDKNSKITLKIVEHFIDASGNKLPVISYHLSDGSISNAGTGKVERTSGERTFIITGEVSTFKEDAYTD